MVISYLLHLLYVFKSQYCQINVYLTTPEQDNQVVDLALKELCVWMKAEVLPLEEEMYLMEARSVRRVPLPALGHQIEYLPGTRWRSTEVPGAAALVSVGARAAPAGGVLHHLQV